jgi:hypothetical protein
MLEEVIVKLEVNSPVARDALLDGCASVIQFEKKDREESTERANGFNPERCERRIVLAKELAEQLVAGHATVGVTLGIADAVARNLAEVIAEEMDALVCDTHDEQPRGAIVGRASGLMATLATLDAGMQRQVIPFDTFALAREAHRPRLPADVGQQAQFAAQM